MVSKWLAAAAAMVALGVAGFSVFTANELRAQLGKPDDGRRVASLETQLGDMRVEISDLKLQIAALKTARPEAAPPHVFPMDGGF